MKLQNVRVKVVESASAANLQTDVNTFLATITQREFVTIQMHKDGTNYLAMITYTE